MVFCLSFLQSYIVYEGCYYSFTCLPWTYLVQRFLISFVTWCVVCVAEISTVWTVELERQEISWCVSSLLFVIWEPPPEYASSQRAASAACVFRQTETPARLCAVSWFRPRLPFPAPPGTDLSLVSRIFLSHPHPPGKLWGADGSVSHHRYHVARTCKHVWQSASLFSSVCSVSAPRSL